MQHKERPVDARNVAIYGPDHAPPPPPSPPSSPRPRQDQNVRDQDQFALARKQGETQKRDEHRNQAVEAAIKKNKHQTTANLDRLDEYRGRSLERGALRERTARDEDGEAKYSSGVGKSDLHIPFGRREYDHYRPRRQSTSPSNRGYQRTYRERSVRSASRRRYSRSPQRSYEINREYSRTTADTQKKGSQSHLERSRSPVQKPKFDRYVPDRKRTSPYNEYTNSKRPKHAPVTAFALRKYSNWIKSRHDPNVQRPAEWKDVPVFYNGDGKVNPSAYGATLDQDLGLCYATFKTRFNCEMGHRCPWRHHPLSTVEKSWIVDLTAGSRRREDFLADARVYWDNPDIPAPGANMLDVVLRENQN